MSHNAWHNARAMYERDACAQAMGMDIIDMGEGYAVVTMTITPQMLNGGLRLIQKKTASGLCRR